MHVVEYGERRYTLAAGETVLDGLLRNGVDAAHSCRAGSCGSCMMKAVAGAVPAKAQTGLRDSWKVQGYFLPCVCLPDCDLSIAAVGSDARTEASITHLSRLSASVLRVRLRCDAPIGHHAGQYLTLVREGGLARSYSIASPTGEPELELHVRLIAGGRMSGWLRDEAKAGERITVQGPSGSCFYVEGQPEQPLLLVGTGTGLAPLFGILRDAFHAGHRGPIHLFHGAIDKAGLYLVDQLRTFARQHANFAYSPVVLTGPEEDGLATGAIDRVVLESHPKPAGWRAYVCGDPSIVQLLKKKLFLAGVSSREIFADAFLPSV